MCKCGAVVECETRDLGDTGSRLPVFYHFQQTMRRLRNICVKLGAAEA
jgi:hypothetical protein